MVDLSNMKSGGQVRTRNGRILSYAGFEWRELFPYRFFHPDHFSYGIITYNRWGNYASDGNHPWDIVEVLSKSLKNSPKSKVKHVDTPSALTTTPTIPLKIVMAEGTLDELLKQFPNLSKTTYRIVWEEVSKPA